MIFFQRNIEFFPFDLKGIFLFKIRNQVLTITLPCIFKFLLFPYRMIVFQENESSSYFFPYLVIFFSKE